MVAVSHSLFRSQHPCLQYGVEPHRLVPRLVGARFVLQRGKDDGGHRKHNKLVRANKCTLDAVLYKMVEDAISDAFSQAAGASGSAQVSLYPNTARELEKLE